MIIYLNNFILLSEIINNWLYRLYPNKTNDINNFSFNHQIIPDERFDAWRYEIEKYSAMIPW